MSIMHWTLILTPIATGITIIGFVYLMLRDFKDEVCSRFDKLEKRMAQKEQRMVLFENKLISKDDLIFWVITGKKIEDVLLEERKPKSDL